MDFIKPEADDVAATMKYKLASPERAEDAGNASSSRYMPVRR